MGRLSFRLVMTLALTVPSAAFGQSGWEREVTEASRRFGIPAAWIERVIVAESGGRTTHRSRPIRSRVGAMGLMQLMPGTWAAMRRDHGLGADPDDPRDNILAGTAYLRAMYDRFGYPGLFGAYNAGPARYAEFLTRGRALPAETVAYMDQVSKPARGVPRALAIDREAGVHHSVPASTTVTALLVPRRAASPSREGVFFALSADR